MSRIHEALQRAKEQAAQDDGPTRDLPEPVTGDDPEVLGREPFPVEMRERSAPVLPTPDPDRSREQKHEEQPAGGDKSNQARGDAEGEDTRGRRRSLFEHMDARLAEKVVADTRMLPASREQYRRLAAVLHDAQNTSGLKVVMIASAMSGEGKTLTAANLALTLSESYQRRVLLIDADLRRPALHQLFRISAAYGLSDGLAPGQDARLVVRQVSSKLSILPAGQPSNDPMAGLTSERMRQLLAEAKTVFDWIIIDTPPLGVLPDANLLASMVEGSILVVRAASTPHEAVRRAAEAIGRQRLIGVVLNQATAIPHGTHDYYHSYSATSDEVAKAGA